MQIIIDIPYGHYLTIKDGYLKDCIKATTEVIVNGTPLDDLRAEIESHIIDSNGLDFNSALCIAIEIIDKYRESEEKP